MPFKISFRMTWLSWLSHIYFSNKERKQQIDRLSVMWLLFAYLSNQSIMLSSSRGQDIFEDFRIRGLGRGLELRSQGRPRGLHRCLEQAANLLDKNLKKSTGNSLNRCGFLQARNSHCYEKCADPRMAGV